MKIRAVFLMSIALAIEAFAGDGGGAQCPPTWSYQKAGADWNIGACLTGHAQSPINLTGFMYRTLPTLTFNYTTFTAAGSKNNASNNFTVSVPPGMSVSGGPCVSPCPLKSFHFHSPSEHTYNGVGYAAELHLVHDMPNGRHFVIAVFIDSIVTTPDNPSFNSIVQMATKLGQCATAPAAKAIPLPSFVPASTNSYEEYGGSLTTPPCDQNVTWNIIRDFSLTASANQLAAITGGPPNARQIQKTWNRIPYSSPVSPGSPARKKK